MALVNIYGDSFGVSSDRDSWVSMLAKHYKIKNYCIPGASEYRILQSIKSNIPDGDIVILVHTNPYRVFVEYNPLHPNTGHKHCDLVFSDIDHHKKTNFGRAAMDYFKYIFSEQQCEDFYDMCIKEQSLLLNDLQVIHTTHFQTNRDMLYFDYNSSPHKGNINHYNKQGNLLVYRHLLQEIVKYTDV